MPDIGVNGKRENMSIRDLIFFDIPEMLHSLVNTLEEQTKSASRRPPVIR